MAFCESNPIFPHIKRLSNRQRPYQTSYYTKEFQLVSRREKNVSAKVLAKKRSSLIVCIVIAILTTMFTGLCSFGLFSSPSLKKIIEGAEKGERMNGNVLISKRKLACDDLNSIFFRTKKVAFSVLGIM